jgi:extracellular elastinolytic metalloproteinase
MSVKRTALVALTSALVALTLVPAPMLAADDERRSADDSVGIALAHVRANADDLGVAPADVRELAVSSSYTSRHNGVTHVNLTQRHDGLDVFGAHATVNVASNGTVVFVGDSLVAGIGRSASGSDDLTPVAAVGAAADGLDLAEPEDLEVLSRKPGPARETLLSEGGISHEPITARLGWQPTNAGLRLAWNVVIDDASDPHLWSATVDAASGDLLAADDWTAHDPKHGLTSALARHTGPSSAASSALAQAVSPSPVIDGSSYRVYDVPKESPNDGDRTLVSNPADALASPFGWHDTNGAVGPEFTITRGNNVHAYLDQDSNNSPDFGDTDGGPGLSFDFPVDLNEHAQAYRDAVVTNLFYFNNIVHDVLYRYGFDEPSGNFQANNYGRGGGQGDYVRAEAADGGGTNNANFSTPAADSGTPRMQMFLFGSSWARFSPPPTVAGVSGQLVDAGNGCNAAAYAGAPAGDWIAIVTGNNTGCQNVEKARQASAAGAQALVVAHTATGAAPILSGSLTTAPPTIPVASITLADGNAIRAAILAGQTTGTVRKHPDHPGIRDGDLENGIIIHEYGHGVSNRLTGGPGINCLSGNEQAGEGWSDYLAISMLLDPALDDPEGPRGMGPYALFQDDRTGNGIRPRPYSRNMEIQPFTYDSIKTGGWLNGTSLALPHGLGHGWAAVLWDMTWDLIDKHGFNPNVYEPWNTGGNNRAIQYVMDGLKFQGCGPGLVVARDAIIAAADLLSDGGDTCTVWASFARRGLGYSAVQGTTNRNDNSEAFDTHPACRRGFSAPVKAPYGTLTTVDAGSTVPMRFTVSGATGLDVLAKNSPYSRLVDCATLETVDASSPFITPRPTPVPAETPGSSRLTTNGRGEYHFNWKTVGEWAGTCREFVLTRADGKQHRAFFRFVAPTA